MSSPYVFDATVQTFQTAVVERSLTVPILLDFWAEWCEPCKVFGPVVERVAEAFGGAFLVAKVDSDAELELSQAFQVQSIPFGVLILDGRPVDAFAGALGEDQLRTLLAKHGIEPLAATPEEPPAEDDPESPEGKLKTARNAARAGDVATARAALEEFPEESPLVGDRDNLLDGLTFLEADLPDQPAAAARLAAARRHFLCGEWNDALREIVASAREDRTFGGGLARRAILLCQAILGPIDEVEEHRRQLATLLY